MWTNMYVIVHTFSRMILIVYTKLHQMLKTVVERFRSFTFSFTEVLIFHVSTIISDDNCQL